MLKTFSKNLARAIRNGAVAVIPTDTLYGIVGSALMPDVVERIYAIRGRSKRKPMIVLVASPRNIARFSVRMSKKQKKLLDALWPGRVSIVLRCPSDRFRYLHRGKRSIAFRVPAWKPLLSLLKRTGPLVAPSANPEGRKPACKAKDSKRYFGNAVDAYVNGRTLKETASTVVAFKKGKVQCVRNGAVPFSMIERQWSEIDNR